MILFRLVSLMCADCFASHFFSNQLGLLFLASMSSCLLCAHEIPTDASLCGSCESEGDGVCAKLLAGLKMLAEMKPSFSVWQNGCKNPSVPVRQPAKIMGCHEIYVGDFDDAKDVDRLRLLGVGCVVNLCPEKLYHDDYWQVPFSLAYGRIHQLILPADDSDCFNIVALADLAFDFMESSLRSGQGVLVHCWAGCNRSVAVAIAFLVCRRKVPLTIAVRSTMTTRGEVLTNRSFRRQLVQMCLERDLALV